MMKNFVTFEQVECVSNRRWRGLQNPFDNGTFAIVWPDRARALFMRVCVYMYSLNI